MGNLVFGNAERPGNSADAAEIPVVRDNDVAIGQGARPTKRPEKASAAARHRRQAQPSIYIELHWVKLTLITYYHLLQLRRRPVARSLPEESAKTLV